MVPNQTCILNVTFDDMNYEQAKTSTTVTKGLYTPKHRYNTRLSVKQQSVFKDENYLLEDESSYSSDRFSTHSLQEFSENLLNPTQLNNIQLVPFLQEKMDFDAPTCPLDMRQWLKNCSIAIVIASLIWYVNDIRIQFNNIHTEFELVNNRISDIVDARLDTLQRLSEMKNMISDIKESRSNFKHSILETIRNEIDKIYMDKTGLTDFALESAGGRIVHLTPGTENYGQPKNSLLGISICEGMHGPRAIIQTGTLPGECWALKGSSGGVVVKLLGSIKVNAISMEHISKNISPSGDSTTAPKDFSVWGMETLTDRGTLLGQFSYDINGPLVQTFPVQHVLQGSYDYVELKILSNHGNNEFTCVYRFRVHGVMEKTKVSNR
ncbi:hypothetical protein ABEB36_010134 [Hypothenemus hampei]|uniref:SUN domain-containing protein n=1 Tax=Hypothenemus hampei TaxID=57062 RepID=A0ABD1EJ43_HYPHA